MPKKPKKPPEYAPLPYGSILMALDVSSSATGWAVGEVGDDNHVEILGFGVFKPTASWDSIRRTDCMIMKIASIVKQYEPDEIVMEWQSSMSTHKRVQGLAVLGQAQGAVRAYLAMTHRMCLLSERRWTKLNGRNARKDVRAEHVKRMVPAYASWVESNPKADLGLDASDALGLILFRVNQ